MIKCDVPCKPVPEDELCVGVGVLQVCAEVRSKIVPDSQRVRTDDKLCIVVHKHVAMLDDAGWCRILRPVVLNTMEQREKLQHQVVRIRTHELLIHQTSVKRLRPVIGDAKFHLRKEWTVTDISESKLNVRFVVFCAVVVEERGHIKLFTEFSIECRSIDSACPVARLRKGKLIGIPVCVGGHLGKEPKAERQIHKGVEAGNTLGTVRGQVLSVHQCGSKVHGIGLPGCSNNGMVTLLLLPS